MTKKSMNAKTSPRTGRGKFFPTLSSNLSIYVDIWCSLNGRFHQRLFDSGVDILKANWHPLKTVTYLMPLLRNFDCYRDHLELLRKEVYSWSNYTDVLFVADYPGMILENYINSRHMSNVSLRVLKGKVTYSEEKSLANESGKLLKLNKGDIVRIATGRFHKVKTTGPHPAGYMYAFINRTKLHLGNAGISELSKARKGFPLFEELKARVRGFKKAMINVISAISFLIFDAKFQQDDCKKIED